MCSQRSRSRDLLQALKPYTLAVEPKGRPVQIQNSAFLLVRVEDRGDSITKLLLAYAELFVSRLQVDRLP